MKKRHSSKIHVQISPDMVAVVDQYAKALYVSRSDYIRLALAEKMQRDPMPPAVQVRQQQTDENNSQANGSDCDSDSTERNYWM